MLEKLDLAETLLCFFERLIRAAEIPSFAGDYLISGFYFFDHRKPPASHDKVQGPSGCQIYSGWLLFLRQDEQADPAPVFLFRHVPLKAAAGARFAIHAAGQGKAWRPAG